MITRKQKNMRKGYEKKSGLKKKITFTIANYNFLL